MCAFALGAEQAEEFDRFGSGGAEPVWHACVELGRLARYEHQILLAEDEPQPSIEDIQPFVALMGLGIGFAPAAAGRDNEFVCLDATGSAGQGQHGDSAAGDRAQMDARISGGWGADEFVERDAVGPGQREQQFEGRPAGTGLEPGQGADRDAGRCRQVSERGVALSAQRAEPGSGRGKRMAEVVVHAGQFARSATKLAVIADGLRWSSGRWSG